MSESDKRRPGVGGPGDQATGAGAQPPDGRREFDVTGGFLTGRLLVAMPGIGDPRFERAVIFLCAHNAEHAMGLAVNRPVEGLKLASVLKRLKVKSSIALPEDLVLMGGPVERDRGFVL